MNKRIVGFLLAVLLVVTGLFFAGCNEKIVDHNIIVTSSNIRYGMVSGDGIYKTKSNVTLTAIPNAGNAFICWIKNEIIVSTEPEFSFEANSETEGKYIAVFQGDNMQHCNLTKVLLNYNSLNTNLEYFYTLTNVKLCQINNSVTTEIFNEEKFESFQNQIDDYIIEFDINNDIIYNKIKSYTFVLYVTVQNPDSTTKTYTNNIIIDFSNNMPNEIKLDISDPSLTMSTSFEFHDLAVSE